MPFRYKVGLQDHESCYSTSSEHPAFTPSSLSQSESQFKLHLIMTFTHGIHFLSLLEQPKDSMGGGYASKHESADVDVEAAINPTEPVTNGHQDDSSLPAPAELTNGYKVEEPTGPTETVAHGSEADVLSESKESNIAIGDIEVASLEEPETHVRADMVAPIPGSTKLQRLLKGTNDLIVCPGVYDGFSARIAMSVGFQCLYMV